MLTSAHDSLVAVVADDHGGLQLEALVPAERAGLPLAQLARVAERLRPSFVELSDLLREFLLWMIAENPKERRIKRKDR